MNENIELDQFAGDYYDDVPDDENSWRKLENLQQKASVQKPDEFLYEEYSDTEKTMDLKFINGRLNQKQLVRTYKLEVNSGESVLLGTTEEWKEVESG
jgi:hypothetical protein